MKNKNILFCQKKKTFIVMLIRLFFKIYMTIVQFIQR
jgi:hypothetical protein